MRVRGTVRLSHSFARVEINTDSRKSSDTSAVPFPAKLSTGFLSF